MAAKSTNPRCSECRSSAIDLTQTESFAPFYLCRDCGWATPYEVIHPEMAEEFCPECSQPLKVVEVEGEYLQIHDVDLRFPKCSIHKAELVQERRAEFKLLQGGRA